MKRANAIYEEDESRPIRCSHNNPLIQKLYKDYLGYPNSEKAHELLHTHYHELTPFPVKE
jgi:iron only hydrogenase large subunit-like protein